MFTTIIARYAPRSRVALNRLIRQLEKQPTHIIVVENSDQASRLSIEKFGQSLDLITRPNTGMNIGAWEAATPYIKGDYLIYLQDECYLNLENPYNTIQEILKKDQDRTLFGESINYRWWTTWGNIKNESFNYIIKTAENPKGIKRVNYYKNKLLSWNINAGEHAGHLRSLILAMTRPVKDRIGYFNSGRTKEECIAAEIAISKKAEQEGLKIAQLNQTPFYYFSHMEWERHGCVKTKNNLINLG